MIRTQVYLSEEQRKRVADRAKTAGTSQASVIREILDEALGIDDLSPDERLARLRQARGIWRERPDWPELIAEFRHGLADRDKRLGLD